MKTQHFRKTFREQAYPLNDHRFGGRAVFPAAAYIEMGRALLDHAVMASLGEGHRGGVELTQIEFEQAFVVSGEATLVATLEDDGGRLSVKFTSGEGTAATTHARLRGGVLADVRSQAFTEADELAFSHSSHQVYEAFRSAGMDYGVEFQSLRGVRLGSDGAHAVLDLAPGLRDTRDVFALHPSMLDGAMQVCAFEFLVRAGDRRMLLPTRIERLSFHAPIADGARVEARRTQSDGTRFDVEVRNPDGRLCVCLEGLTGATVAVVRAQLPEPLLLTPGFFAMPAPERQQPDDVPTLVFGPQDAGEFAAHWIERGPGQATHLEVCSVCSPPEGTGHWLEQVSLLGDLAHHPALRPWLARAANARRVVLLLDEHNMADPGAVRSLFELMQVLVDRPVGAPTQLVLGAGLCAAIGAKARRRNASVHAMAAMLRTVAAEHHDLAVTVVTQQSTDDRTLSRRVIDEVPSSDKGFEHVRYVAGERRVEGVDRHAGVSQRTYPADKTRVVLITGGLGAIGSHLADGLRARGFSRIALVGRTPRAEAESALARRWEGRGDFPSYHEADVADAARLKEAVDRIVAEQGQIGMVLHAAGSLRDGLFQGKDWRDFESVIAPKLQGTDNLDEATSTQPLSHFVLFSSISSLFGNPGQSDYAFANGYLDQFAEERNKAVSAGLRQGRTMAINWGLWREGGMSVPPSVERWLHETTGMTPLPTAAAMKALDMVLERGCERALAVSGTNADIERFFRVRTACTGPDLRMATEALVIRLVAAALKTDPDQLSADSRFETLGFDSFLVIQTSRQLEAFAGRVSKSLFYEAKTLGELSGLLQRDHADALHRALMPGEVSPEVPVSPLPQRDAELSPTLTWPDPPQPGTDQRHAVFQEPVAAQDTASPVLIGEVRQLLGAAPAFAKWMHEYLATWGDESALAAATEDIGPNVFLAGGRGLFFFNSTGATLFVFSYCGPVAHFAAALKTLQAFAQERSLALQLLLEDEQAEIAREAGFSTTRFGVMQVLPDLAGFSLSGTRMRRVRYLCDKVNKAGRMVLAESKAPFEPKDVEGILGMVDRWCETKERVNPYVLRVRAELAAGALHSRHRVFVTRLDDRMINVIVLTEVPRRHGYLMDLEFYGPDMPLGGLDWSICRIVEQLKAEGAAFFSLGATFGTLYGDCKGTDSYALSALQEMHAAGVLNNDGNFQFKNKYRPDNRTIYICRGPESDAASLGDALLLFGNPSAGALDAALSNEAAAFERWAGGRPLESPPPSMPQAPVPVAAALPSGQVVDLRTDSWGELEDAFVTEYLDQGLAGIPAEVTQAAREVFSFGHIFTAAQGRQAEGLLYKALAAVTPIGRRRVLQNVLFPTQVYHQLDHGFEPLELSAGLPQLLSGSGLFADDLDLARLEQACADAALVMFELCPNVQAGRPASLGFLRKLSATCRRRGVPLFFDATRIIDNALLIAEHESPERGRPVREIVREICSLADGLSASLAKDFSLTDGAILACNDDRLADEIGKLQKLQGRGLSRRQEAVVAGALGCLGDAERRVQARTHAVQRLSHRMAEAGMPVVLPAGAHCVLIDAGGMDRFAAESSPAEACVEWLLAAAQVRAAPHLGSSLIRGERQRFVRLALPVGMPTEMIERIEQSLIAVYPASAKSPVAEMAAGPDASSRAALALPSNDMAVVGLAMRCAGADDVQAFWSMLQSGACAIAEVPASRWDFRRELDRNGKPTTRWGGFLGDVDAFDSLFFRISPREAELMDPQERLFLEAAWTALEDAGYSPAELKRVAGGNVGVFVGAVWSLYHTIGHEQVLKGNLVAPNSFHWSIANRVSYALDVTGPSMAVDTACSSSLTALHLACESIARGECGMAVVGGVNLDLHPSKPRVTNVGNVLSDSGRCASFGADADGYVPGEGVGAVIIKPLQRAMADGDHVYAVIKSTQINHGGRTNGYAVPSPSGQSALVAAALRKAGTDARTITCIEAHGTGTALGDPIEVAGLSEAFGAYTADRQFCAIGSVKSNIGHLEAAAGVAGLIKVILQMQHRRLVPSLHAQRLNPNIAFETTPFFVQRELATWAPMDRAGRPLPRRAGLSSFGAGGANAHAVIEEAPLAPLRAHEPVRPELVPLSARTQNQLTAAARDLLTWLEKGVPPEARLADIAFTLAMGRAEMDCRLALVADSVDSLRLKLRAALAADAGEGGWYQGTRQRSPAASGRSELQDLAAQARLWCSGTPLAWELRFEGRSVRRLSLPTVRFEQVRHWIAATPVCVPSAPHPLIDAVDHRDPLLFHKRLSASDFVLADHLVAGNHTLPGVTYIEMARAAVALYLHRDDSGLRLTNVTWLQPIMLASGAIDVQIRLSPEEGQVAVAISTRSEGADAPRLHAQCKVVLSTETQTQQAALEISTHGGALSGSKDRPLIYRTLRAMGMEHRIAFQVLLELRHGPSEGVALMELPAAQQVDFDRYFLHPSLMDGALQAAAVLVKRPEDGTGVPDIPFVIKEVRACRPAPARCWARVRLDPRSTESVRRFDIDIADEQGQVCVAIRGFSVRPFKGPAKRGPAVAGLPDDLLFYVDEPVPAASGPSASAMPMLVYCDEPRMPSANDLQQEAALVTAASRSEPIGPRHFGIDWGDASAVERLATWLHQAGFDTGASHLFYLASASSSTSQFEHVRRMAWLMRGLPRTGAGQQRRLCFAYPSQVPLLASLAGAVRSLVQETPRASAVTLALDPACSLAQAVAIAAPWHRAEFAEGMVVELAHESDSLHRICRHDVSEALRAAVPAGWGQGKSYLITGAAGGIGRALARHLAGRHGARLTLVGRRTRDADIEGLLNELVAGGGQADYVQADVSDADQAARAVKWACERHGTVHGVLHCAGTVQDRLARDKTAAEFEAVTAAKTRGIEHIDRATAHLQPELFVAFSSVASALGNIGQSDYAAANRFLDLYCARRASRSIGRSLSIRWPLWADGGMSVGDAAWEFVQRRSGMRKLATDEALQVLELALGSPYPVIGVAAGDVLRLRSWLRIEDGPSVQEAECRPTPSSPQISQDPVPMTQPDDQALPRWVCGELTRIAARLLKLKPDELDSQRDMSDYGIDSVMLTEFTNEVNKRFELDLSPIAFFEFPDLQGLSQHMVEEFGERLKAMAPAQAPSVAAPLPPKPAAQVPPPAPIAAAPVRVNAGAAAAGADEPIAIVGLHARLPGARELDEFWAKLVGQESMLSEVPADRFDWRRFVGDPQRDMNKMSSKWGGFIDDIDKFDPLFFRLSPLEAAFMDPQQRVFLETVWHTIEDAGYRPSDLSDTRTGIFVGLATSDYIELLQTTYPQVETYMTTGNAHSVLPNRISYLLNLRGPSEPVDTACSSSLVALHRAAQSIRAGECDSAIAGGIGLMLTPTTFISFSRAGMLSPDGRCKTFDKDANGYVRGEGSAAVLLKPLKRAIADGDHIYGVLRGSAINHGGYATSLTAPNPNAQAEVIVEAHRRAGVDVDAVGYIEAHGTGTPLGDPVEIAGLKKAFKTLRAEQGKTQLLPGQCGIGSVKSNIGHLEAAAGMAGVVKVLLALKHRVLPPTQHVNELNPYIDLANTPFYIATEQKKWATPRDAQGRVLPRCTGVSSFGFGGVNAHVVIEEYLEDGGSEAAAQGPGQLFVLSAKTEAALLDSVRNLGQFLRRAVAAAQPPRAADVAYTLQVGRTVFVHRAAFTAARLEEALERCEHILQGQEDAAVFRSRAGVAPSTVATLLGKSGAGREFVRTLIRNGELSVLGMLWVDGMDIDFGSQDGAQGRRRVPLPGYPFARERYWIPYEDITDAMARQALHPQAAALVAPAGHRHPMLDAPSEPAADGVCRTFSKRFSGDEFYFADHRLNQQPLMPAAGCLEMVAAIVKESPGADIGLEIRDVVWSRPLSAGRGRGDELTVALDAVGEGSGYRAVIRDAGASPEDESARYATGRVQVLDRATIEQRQASLAVVSPVARRDLCTVERGAAQVYQDFGAIGLDYGERFRSVLQLHGNDEETVGVVELPAVLNADFGDYLLHPALIDGALQCIDGLTTDGEFDTDRLSVPYSLERLTSFAPLPRKLLVHVALRRGGRQLGVKIVDIQLFDVNQSLVAVLEGFAIRSLRRADRLSAASSLIEERQRVGAGSAAAVRTETVARAAAMPVAPSTTVLAEQTLVSLVAQALKMPPARVGLDTGFDQFGIDSLSISRLSTTLEETFGSLPKTLFFEHNNLRELAAYFARHHAPALRRRAGDADPAVPAPATDPAPVSVAGSVQTRPAAAERDWNALAQQMLVKVVSEALKLPFERVSLDTGFDQYGIDSLSISRLTTRLEELFGSLPKTLFFEYNNLRQMASLFASRHQDALVRFHRLSDEAAAPASTAMPVSVPPSAPIASVVPRPIQDQVPVPSPTRNADDIAIVGIAGRYPQADDLEEYWCNLRDGRDCIEPIPAERWDPALHGDTPSRFGGFIRGVDQFDSAFFNISPREAKALDPNERLFLETAWAAVEDAGYRSEALGRLPGDSPAEGGSVGVFVGVMWGQYAHHGLERWTKGQHALTTSTYWSIANRVSYAMNFQGPSMAIDTACSSSLSAIHMACESLRHGECRAAVAGGVNLNIHPIKYADLGAAGFLSTDGRCRSYGEGGDGYVPGEGVGAVVLKRLEDALRDGDHVHVVIKASALNHSGKTSGFSVPGPVAQGRLVRTVIDRSKVPVESIGYIEGHGTGTSLGDAIEVAGLARGFEGESGAPLRCAIGSVKSNIGHLEAASGVAALTKVVLQMRHGQIVPSLHSRNLNPNIAFDGTPFFVVQSRSEWPRPLHPEGAASPRRACVNSFGAGGSNAHLVVEEFIDDRAARPVPSLFGAELVVLSARDDRALSEAARRLLAHLDAGSKGAAMPGLDRIAHTLQTGRRPAEYRLALIAADHRALCAGLSGYLDSGADNATVFTGTVDPARQEAAADPRTLIELARAWVNGSDIAWEKFRTAGEPMRCPLPVYAFQRRRHWLDGAKGLLYARASSNSSDACGAGTAPPGRDVQRMLIDLAAAQPGASVAVLQPSWLRDTDAPKLHVEGTDLWMLLTDDEHLEARLRDALARAGAAANALVVVQRGRAFKVRDDARFEIEPGDAAQAELLLRHLKQEGRRPTRILNAWNWSAQTVLDRCSEDERSDRVAELQRSGVQTLFALTRAWLMSGLPDNPTLLHLHEVQPGAASPTEISAAGFSRCLEREDPRLRARVVEFWGPPDIDTLGDQILSESLDREPQRCHVRRADGGRYVQCLSDNDQASALIDVPAAVPWVGTCLITGGLGGIGRKLADSLAHPAVSLVLVSRSGPDAHAQRWLDELARRCRQVRHYVADCTDLDAMRFVMHDVHQQFGPLGGVIHAAGVVDDGLLLFKKPQTLAEVLAPKVAGTVVLDQVTREEPLQFFLMLSSLVSAIGSPGQTDYGSANAFLDGFALHRQTLVAAGRRQGRSVAVDLPLWCEGSMSVSEDNIRQQGEAYGIVPMSSAEGLRTVHAAMRSPSAQWVVFSGHIEKMKQVFGVVERSRVDPDAFNCDMGGVSEPLAAQVDRWLQAHASADDGSDPRRLTIHEASMLCAWLHSEHGLSAHASDVRRCSSAPELAAWLQDKSKAHDSEGSGHGRRRFPRPAVEDILDRLEDGALDAAEAQRELDRLVN